MRAVPSSAQLEALYALEQEPITLETVEDTKEASRESVAA